MQQLEKLLGVDSNSSLYDGPISFTATIKQDRISVWSHDIGYYKDRSVLNCKQMENYSRSLQSAINKITNNQWLWDKLRNRAIPYRAIPFIGKISIMGNNDKWNKIEYVPIIYDITNEWNNKIKDKIDERLKDIKKRIYFLNKKLIYISFDFDGTISDEFDNTINPQKEKYKIARKYILDGHNVCIITKRYDYNNRHLSKINEYSEVIQSKQIIGN